MSFSFSGEALLLVVTYSQQKVSLTSPTLYPHLRLFLADSKTLVKGGGWDGGRGGGVDWHKEITVISVLQNGKLSPTEREREQESFHRQTDRQTGCMDRQVGRRDGLTDR